MVGHAWKGWGAYREKNILLVLGLRCLHLMLRGTVRWSECGSTVGGLLMLIYWCSWWWPRWRLRALRGWGSNIQSGVGAVNIVPWRDLQSLRDIGYTLWKCHSYRVHGVTRDGGERGRHALHCGWRSRGARRPVLIVHKKWIVAGGGGHGSRGWQGLGVTGSLGFNMAVACAVH